MSISRTIARPLLASTFLIGATHALKHSDVMAQRAETVTDRLVPLVRKAVPGLPQDPQTLVKVNAGVQLCAADGSVTNRDHARAWLPSTIGPRETRDVLIEVPVPDARGRYQLKLDLVAEGIDWFEACGPVRRSLGAGGNFRAGRPVVANWRVYP